MLQLVEGLIKSEQMILGCIFGYISTGLHQLQPHLQRGVAQKAAQLGLGDDLGGHQVQHHDLQRTNVLGAGSALFHHEYIFLLQRFCRRQVIGNLNGHTVALLFAVI